MKIGKNLITAAAFASFSAVIILSFIPHPPEILDAFSLSDKIYHASAYCFMTFLIFLALKTSLPEFCKVKTVTFLFSSATGLSIELLQPYFSRTGDAADFAADIAGIFAALLLSKCMIDTRIIRITKEGVFLFGKTP